MTTKRVQEGEMITIVAPYAVTKGNIVIFGAAFGVAIDNAASGANLVVDVSGGVWTLPKTAAASNSFALGANAYWDNTNSAVTASATSNTRIGVAVVAAATGDTTGTFRVNPSF